LQSGDQRTFQPAKGESRRNFLRRAAATVIGAGILLVGLDLTGTLGIAQEVGSVGTSKTTDNPSNTPAQLITVTVFYSMMAQITDLSQEFFVLQSPATLSDLINTIVIRHPGMAQMMQTMLTLLNGVPAKPSASLNDRDVVQLIPLSSGG